MDNKTASNGTRNVQKTLSDLSSYRTPQYIYSRVYRDRIHNLCNSPFNRLFYHRRKSAFDLCLCGGILLAV